MKPAQAGALTTPLLPESCRAGKLHKNCVEGALERGLAGQEARSWHKASSVASPWPPGAP